MGDQPWQSTCAGFHEESSILQSESYDSQPHPPPSPLRFDLVTSFQDASGGLSSFTSPCALCIYQSYLICQWAA
jgi:hypothetical protein